MRFVYSKSHLVLEVLDELGIEYEPRAFGVIPSDKHKGGALIIREMQKGLNVLTNSRLVDFTKHNGEFEVRLQKPEGIATLNTKNLVLATGGYGGTFEHTNNVRYSSYGIFDLVRKNGGNIINEGCIFYHPFGYNCGKKILIGAESKRGRFVDESDNSVFSRPVELAIRNDAYHELFDQVLLEERKCEERGSMVMFKDEARALRIHPTVHYTSGGVETDHLGRVKGCKNLFAIGECQANGSRKNGRFPGYPYTAAVVYGYELGKYLMEHK